MRKKTMQTGLKMVEKTNETLFDALSILGARHGLPVIQTTVNGVPAIIIDGSKPQG